MGEWQDSYVQSNGIRLHYTRTGVDKRPIVLAHGLTDSGLCWSRLARELERTYDLVMVDARGHGLSDKPEHGYGPREHVKDLAGLIDALGLNKPVVIGHSMGGATASMLAAEYPDLIRAAILEDPAWHWPKSPEAEAAEVRQNYEAWRLRGEARQALSAEELYARGRLDNPSWSAEEFEPWVAAKQQLAPQVIEIILENERTWPQQVAAYQVPVLLIYGEPALGGILGSEMAGEAKYINPLVQPVHISGAGHNIRRERFDGYVAVIREFLAFIQRG